MAKTKISEKDLSVESRLKALYQLQTILSEIDKIKTLRGELPLEVQDLEDEIAGLETRVEHYQEGINDLDRSIVAEREIIVTAKELLDKYEEQIKEVRNNREFDALTKQIEYQGLEAQHSEKKIREATAQLGFKKEELEAISARLEERRIDLKEKTDELGTIIEETRTEEEKLIAKAKDVEGKIEERLLIAFKRIRKSARNGLGVVTIQRDACGGCYNKIPAQRQLEVKLHKKVIVCEYCGRILIDPDL